MRGVGTMNLLPSSSPSSWSSSDWLPYRKPTIVLAVLSCIVNPHPPITPATALDSPPRDATRLHSRKVRCSTHKKRWCRFSEPRNVVRANIHHAEPSQDPWRVESRVGTTQMARTSNECGQGHLNHYHSPLCCRVCLFCVRGNIKPIYLRSKE
jgi:hypothetical protein